MNNTSSSRILKLSRLAGLMLALPMLACLSGCQFLQNEFFSPVQAAPGDAADQPDHNPAELLRRRP